MRLTLAATILATVLVSGCGDKKETDSIPDPESITPEQEKATLDQRQKMRAIEKSRPRDE